MREIKFRAWDKSHKLMGEVTFIKFSEVQYMQVKYRVNDNGKVIDEWSNLDDDGFGTCVLMQSTGLKDKNGVEIYEGDIVHRRTHLVLYGTDLDDMVDNYYLVEWKYGGWHIGEDLIDLVSEAGINGQTLCEETALQVVGNIHENPELLQNNGVIE